MTPHTHHTLTQSVALHQGTEATRMRLLRSARAAGVSTAPYESDAAWRARKAMLLAAAREEAILDEQNPLAAAEYELWEGTLEDGVD
jgi:hypothetical protein